MYWGYGELASEAAGAEPDDLLELWLRAVDPAEVLALREEVAALRRTNAAAAEAAEAAAEAEAAGEQVEKKKPTKADKKALRAVRTPGWSNRSQ